MFGANEAVLAYIRRLVGAKTDRLDINGSLHSKIRGTMLSGVFFLNDGYDGLATWTTNTTLESGIYRLSSATVNSGVTLTPTGSFLGLFIQGTLTINGTLSASGKGAAGGSGANATNNAGHLPGYNGVDGFGPCGSGGGAGGTTLARGGGGGSTDVFGSNGGLNNPGTTGNNCTKGGRFASDLRDILSFCGAGGGGGAGYSGSSSYSGKGGSGGAGGGCIFIVADTIIGTGAIRADGLSGGTANNGTSLSAAGGGGGGGGGCIFLFAKTISIPMLTVAGGAAGAMDTAGNPGAAGGNGSVIKIPL
ncbi:hypothetical protein GJ688_02505 [Heliobacillus mobilis]|uniref:Uncharacterized protein n=1 Tax=Heliobacterium mobile TaxID=28064 RepID=A0A6I3SDM3_HELMO|nr:hypothetical protein [Heliobacterium mobile]MTV47855.1 hypothetical protein [Heliobacterium mobile]